MYKLAMKNHTQLIVISFTDHTQYIRRTIYICIAKRYYVKALGLTNAPQHKYPQRSNLQNNITVLFCCCLTYL